MYCGAPRAGRVRDAVPSGTSSRGSKHEVSLEQRGDRGCTRGHRAGLGATYRPRRGRERDHRPWCQPAWGTRPLLTAVQSAGGVSGVARHASDADAGHSGGRRRGINRGPRRGINRGTSHGSRARDDIGGSADPSACPPPRARPRRRAPHHASDTHQRKSQYVGQSDERGRTGPPAGRQHRQPAAVRASLWSAARWSHAACALSARKRIGLTDLLFARRPRD
jgi:hypothetical protein